MTSSRKAPKEIVDTLAEILASIDDKIESAEGRFAFSEGDRLYLQTWVRHGLRRSLAWARGEADWRLAGRTLS